jgi:hypothetical protein
MTDTLTDDLTEVVGDFSIPCDYAGEAECPDLPAEWVLYRKPCCLAGVAPKLACEPCKEARLMDGMSVECEHCGHVYDHAPDAYSYMERING